MSTPFTVARTWKKFRCPSVDESIKKLWYICTMEFESIVVMWMNLELVAQSEVIQKEENKYCILIQEPRRIVLMNLFVGQE